MGLLIRLCPGKEIVKLHFHMLRCRHGKRPAGCHGATGLVLGTDQPTPSTGATASGTTHSASPAWHGAFSCSLGRRRAIEETTGAAKISLMPNTKYFYKYVQWREKEHLLIKPPPTPVPPILLKHSNFLPLSFNLVQMGVRMSWNERQGLRSGCFKKMLTNYT